MAGAEAEGWVVNDGVEGVDDLDPLDPLDAAAAEASAAMISPLTASSGARSISARDAGR